MDDTRPGDGGARCGLGASGRDHARQRVPPPSGRRGERAGRDRQPPRPPQRPRSPPPVVAPEWVSAWFEPGCNGRWLPIDPRWDGWVVGPGGGPLRDVEPLVRSPRSRDLPERGPSTLDQEASGVAPGKGE